MQLIFLLLLLFIIGCVFNGIAEGVKTFGRFTAWISNPFVNRASAANPVPTPPLPTPQSAPAQNCLHQLQELHSLYQSGGLSKEEYEQLKQYLLAGIAPATAADCPDAA